MSKFLLNDGEIEATKREAKRLSWTHKAHPRFEEEKFLLHAQAKKLVEWMVKNNIRTEWSEKTDKKWQSLLKELE